MKKIGLYVFSMLALLVATTGIANAKPNKKTCDGTAVASAMAAVDAACPCAGRSDGIGGTVPWKNHGQYVSCVAKARKTAAKGGGMHQQCLKSAVVCASHSTCGKSDAVACINTTGTCLNDPAPGDSTAAGTCDNDSTKACDTDADCSVAMCSVSSAEECALTGGTAASGTCCSQ